MSEFKTIAQVGSIPEGQGEAIPLDGKMIAVFNDGGTYRAIDDFCPHMGASLAAGHLEDGVVSCPWHAWRFDVCDGTWCDNPKLGVTAYEVIVEGNDIKVKIPPKEPKANEAKTDSSTVIDSDSTKNDSIKTDSMKASEAPRDSNAENTGAENTDAEKTGAENSDAETDETEQ